MYSLNSSLFLHTDYAPQILIQLDWGNMPEFWPVEGRRNLHKAILAGQ